MSTVMVEKGNMHTKRDGMIRSLIAGVRIKKWRRAFSVLLIVTLLMPSVAMAPISNGQMEQIGTPDETLTLSADAAGMAADGWWNLGPFLGELATSLNWD